MQIVPREDDEIGSPRGGHDVARYPRQFQESLGGDDAARYDKYVPAWAEERYLKEQQKDVPAAAVHAGEDEERT